MKGVINMKTNYYFIGVSKRSEKIINGLLDFGATLMFYYHPKTMELNNQDGFYDGEWLLYSCPDIDTSEMLEKIRSFLDNERMKDRELKTRIYYYKTVKFES